ncbi:MAG: hypothetical protein U9Q19_02630 [Pseudomonadota bacterium]|nr:hypothetical protein [Pseudomonadota bacterium]
MNRRLFLKCLAALGITPLPTIGKVKLDEPVEALRPPEELPEDPSGRHPIRYGDPRTTVTKLLMDKATFYVAGQPIGITQCVVEVTQEEVSIYKEDELVEVVPVHRTTRLTFNVQESSIVGLAEKLPERGQESFGYKLVHANDQAKFCIAGERAALYSAPRFDKLDCDARLEVILLGEVMFNHGEGVHA